MRAVTIILLGCCLLGFAGLVFLYNRLSTDTARDVARLEGEVNELKRRLADAGGTAPPPATQVVASADNGLIRATETGRLYSGYFRVRSCPAGYLNVESDRIEGISIWCMKKQ
jgi:hypothetical protein